MDEQKLIHDPSQKVLAMYQAVIEFINEGCDINTLKVADITGRAGIGKGTAYEYFSSKEEIISSAILYYVKVCFEKLQVISTDNRTFQQKINEVMDFIYEHVKEKLGFDRGSSQENILLPDQTFADTLLHNAVDNLVFLLITALLFHTLILIFQILWYLV